MSKALQAAVLSLASLPAAAQNSPGVNATTYWIYGLVGAVFVIGFIIAFVMSKRRDSGQDEKPPGPGDAAKS